MSTFPNLGNCNKMCIVSCTRYPKKYPIREFQKVPLRRAQPNVSASVKVPILIVRQRAHVSQNHRRHDGHHHGVDRPGVLLRRLKLHPALRVVSRVSNRPVRRAKQDLTHEFPQRDKGQQPLGEDDRRAERVHGVRADVRDARGGFVMARAGKHRDRSGSVRASASHARMRMRFRARQRLAFLCARDENLVHFRAASCYKETGGWTPRVGGDAGGINLRLIALFWSSTTVSGDREELF